MNHRPRRSPFEALLADPDLRALDAIAPAFDPLEVLATARKERPHTRFLAWLLDPHPVQPGASHGLGASVLDALVCRALSALDPLPGAPFVRASVPPSFVPASLRVLREQPLGDHARAPDLRCHGADARGREWVVLIENKLDADEGDGQLSSYLAWSRAKHPGAERLLIYVSPDRRTPREAFPRDRVACLAWSDVVDAALSALRSELPRAPSTLAARAFAETTLDALRMRFGAHPEARALVEALHHRHPRDAARCANLTPDDPDWERLQPVIPNALWHLRSVRPQAVAFTRAFSDRVAAAWNALHPEAPALRPGAPHARLPELAAWSIDGVTEAWSVHLVASAGPHPGALRPRLWLALYAPNTSPGMLLDSREHSADLALLPSATREALAEARPVPSTPGSWRWLQLGRSVELPRGFSPEDDARRVVDRCFAAFGGHLAALAARSLDSSRWLYSCDRDDLLHRPTDAVDRRALSSAALPGAERALLVATQPGGHPGEFGVAHELGTALGRSLGERSLLSYDYGPAAGLGLWDAPTLVVLEGALFDDPDALGCVRSAMAAGATLVLLPATGEGFTEAGKRSLRPWADAVRGGEGRAEASSLTAPGGDRGTERWLRRLQQVDRVALRGDATVALRVEGDDGRLPLLAGWREGAASVVCWTGDLRAVTTDDELTARWWAALLAVRDALKG
ncbi:MAG: PD-(D/E)XK nuclease family protein [Deltaproteobacteria bacterium]|nr:PD-(D/E)XK nuclease family protein [Deltaproteobacteria bacterium]MBP6829356.1 PD-(D/E)XK nuclease family protein [Deltaproteobacteria bacterium]